MSGVMLLPEYPEAEVDCDGKWLTTASWNKFVLHLFTHCDLRAQVPISII
jgi:hypothetical protein